jgi:hypothetical protein
VGQGAVGSPDLNVSLEDQTIEELKDLLCRCTVRVGPGNGKGGTGFFIDEDLILTCHHVVKNLEDGDIKAFAAGNVERDVKHVDRAPELDLALLHLAPSTTMVQNAVLLLGKFDGGRVVTYGFPKDDFTPADTLEPREYKASKQTLLEGQLNGFRLSDGNVASGQSGGPMMDLATGTVVGIVRYSLSLRGVVGGGAIPLITAAEKWEEVAALAQRPPLSANEWRQTLGPDACGVLRIPGPEVATLELFVEGDPKKWTVSLKQGDPGSCELTVHDLGESVAEVLFQLAQRGRVRTKNDVRLVGQLLSGALFPASLALQLSRVMQANEVLVRLYAEGTLADVPWELSTFPGDEGRYLATEEKVRFVRAVPHPNSEEAGAAARRRTARVLGIVVPTEDQPQRRAKSVFANSLKKKIAAGSSDSKVLENPLFSEVDDELKAAMAEQKPYDVVHYYGLGHFEREGERALLSFAGGKVKDDEFFDKVCQRKVRVVVLQFATPPPGGPAFESIPPSVFIKAIRGSVIAIVSTLVPLETEHAEQFNTKFYDAVFRGETVGAAVQHGRRTLQSNHLLDDYAVFGWLSLLCAPLGGIKLINPPMPSEKESKESENSSSQDQDSRRQDQDAFG